MNQSLKYASIFALIGAADIAVTAVVLAAGAAGPRPDIVELAIMFLTACFGAVLGIQGTLAYRGPSRAGKLLPIALVALLINAAGVILALRSGVALVATCMNALITVWLAHALKP